MATANSMARAEKLLSFGPAAADELGKQAGMEAANALALLEDVSAGTTDLLGINQRLVPLMAALQRDGKKAQHSWWRRFTGAQLEYDVHFDDMRTDIEDLAHAGKQDHDGLGRNIARMRVHYQLMATELRLLEEEIAAGHLLASAAWAERRAAAGMDFDDLARLTRRASNLEAMATATQLTRAQFKLAIEHARTVSDRYREIQTLLLPIWRQSVGFDLFSRNTTASKEN